MKRGNWLVVAGIGLVAMGTVAIGAPTAAADTGSWFDCSYTIDRHTKTITGERVGSTLFGEASGALTGTVSAHGGSLSGYVTVSTLLGYGAGSFDGTVTRTAAVPLRSDLLRRAEWSLPRRVDRNRALASCAGPASSPSSPR